MKKAGFHFFLALVVLALLPKVLFAQDTTEDAAASMDVDTPPRVLKRIDPIYPKELQRYGIEGRVYLSFVVRTDGSVTDVTVKKSPDDLLSEAAISAIQNVPWQPATRDGKAVDCRAVVPIRFELAHGFERVDIDPMPQAPVVPIYPKRLKKKGVEGDVEVEFAITSKGLVESIEVLEATRPDFAKATIEALMASKWEPAILNDRPIYHIVRKRFTFHLED